MDFARVYRLANGEQILVNFDVNVFDRSYFGEPVVRETAYLDGKIVLALHGFKSMEAMVKFFERYSAKDAQNFFDFITGDPTPNDMELYDEKLRNDLLNRN